VPTEREQDEYFFMDESTEMYPSGKKGTTKNDRASSKKPQSYYP
jgi:hypothetical protein